MTHVEHFGQPRVGCRGPALHFPRDPDFPFRRFGRSGDLLARFPRFAQQGGQLTLPFRFPQLPDRAALPARFLGNSGINFFDPPAIPGGGDSPTGAVAAGQIVMSGRIALLGRFEMLGVFSHAADGVRKLQAFQEAGPAQSVGGVFSEEFRITGECVMSEVGQREKAGSHRIEMNVVDQPQQRASLVNKDALVTALEHVSPLAVEAVKAVGEGSLQPRHALHKVRFRRFQGEVVMVAHQDIGMDDPPAFFAGLGEGPFESCRRPHFAKQVFAVIPPVDHMVNRAFKLPSRLACHDVASSPPGRGCNI